MIVQIPTKKYPNAEWVEQKKRFQAWCEKKGYFPHTKYFEAWLAALEEKDVE